MGEFDSNPERSPGDPGPHPKDIDYAQMAQNMLAMQGDDPTDETRVVELANIIRRYEAARAELMFEQSSGEVRPPDEPPAEEGPQP